MPLKIFIVLMAFTILAVVVNLIRCQKMTFKFAVNWFAGCGLALLLAFNEDWLFALARFAGFSLPSNFVFFLLLIFVVLLSLGLTIYINEQNSRTEALGQAVARLEQEVKKLRGQ